MRTGAISAIVVLLISGMAYARPTPVAHVEERGHGPINVILIPGLSCDWRVYDAFMTRNADKYHMFAVTLPGFGTSDPPPLADAANPNDGPWLANAEAAIAQLIQDRKLDKPVVMGHSLGGLLATRMAIHHGDMLRATISIDGLPIFPPPMPQQPDTPEARAAMVKQMKAMLGNVPEEQWKTNQKRTVASLVTDPARAKELGEMCSAVPRATTVEYLLEDISSDLRGELSKIKIPSLTISAISLDMGPQVLNQLRDVIAAEFKSAPPNVQLVFIEDSRHFVMDDHPQDLDRIVAEFLAGKKPQDVKAATTQPAKSGS